MKKKTLILIAAALLTVVFSAAAFAASYVNPGELVSGLTGKSEAEIYTERSQGKTFGQIAEDNGQLDKFRSEMQEYKKEIIDERVKAGVISKENGEALKKAIEERIAACTGTPGANQERLGQQFGGGMKFGGGQGGGFGKGMGQGMGFGRTVTR
ncbi:MAG: hypothetical protein JM58_13735 [Peptococcaceae bacterium BICA1-8]|nr:MAG: hypothetical protein JM58_13735 [Peptococcaceae bacterium BICA1-8]